MKHATHEELVALLAGLILGGDRELFEQLPPDFQMESLLIAADAVVSGAEAALTIDRELERFGIKVEDQTIREAIIATVIRRSKSRRQLRLLRNLQVADVDQFDAVVKGYKP